MIVSASDAGYFNLVMGLVLSIREHRPTDAVSIGILDLGLSDVQGDKIRSLGGQLAATRWDFDFPSREKAPRWFQAMTARCHLPAYFPGFDVYIWLDADAWIQDWRVIDLLIRSADEGALGIVQEMHSAYGCVYDRGNSENHDNRLVLDFFAKAYGQEFAQRLATLPMLNSGVFAIRGDSAAWQIWGKWMQVGLAGPLHKLIEQNALNAAVYSGQISFHPLPAWCNWICGQALPKFDAKTKRFVEPFLPYEPISALHVTPRNRANSTIQTLDGRSLAMSLDYLPFKSGALSGQVPTIP